MTHFDFDIGVIGGGAAGLTVTSGAAQLGAKSILIEKEKKLGGDCLHFGCVPSKTLIRTAQVYHQMKHPEAYGLPPLHLPPVDFRHVSNRIRSVVEVIQKHDSEERFCRLGAKVVFGDAVFVDPHEVQIDNRSVTAAKWVIATGSSAVVPPIEGLRDTPHITNREIFYLDRLPASLLILGAGPIGIEMAQAFSRLGSNVTVVDRADQILTREDRDMADTVMQVLQNEGVTFYLNTAITAVADRGDKRAVKILLPENREMQLEAEQILVAMGRKPNVEGLGLEDIGVVRDRQGIAVDARLRTNYKHIFAAGDVNGGYQFTHAAGYEGGIVVANAVFRLPRKVDYKHLPWCTYTEPELASIGMNETAAAAADVRYSVYTEAFRDNDRSLAEGETTGRIKMILDEKEKPLGIQILGPHAGELVNEWVAVMAGGVKLSALAGAIHPYPTIGEINKRVAGSYLSPKIFSDRVRRGLKFFFNLKGRACGSEAAENQGR